MTFYVRRRACQVGTWLARLGLLAIVVLSVVVWLTGSFSPWLFVGSAMVTAIGTLVHDWGQGPWVEVEDR